MVSDYDIYFQGMQVAMVPTSQISVRTGQIVTEQRIYHLIHEHNLSMKLYTNRNSKLKVQSQAVKLLTRGGCHGPEIAPIRPCESGLSPVLNGPWEATKID